MSPGELLAALTDLARELDLDVRRVGPGGEAPGHSLTGRLRDRVVVLLSSEDPVERRVEVLAAALRTHRADACESRYLQPAVREALDPESSRRRGGPSGAKFG